MDFRGIAIEFGNVLQLRILLPENLFCIGIDPCEVGCDDGSGYFLSIIII
jgi:hypothetical protein